MGEISKLQHICSANSPEDLSKYILYKPGIRTEENPRGLGDEFFKCMKKHSDKIFQIDCDTGTKETFGQVLVRCVRTAIEMKRRCLQPKDIICICSNDHVDNYTPIIAAYFIGALVSSSDPKMSVEENIHILSTLRPKMIFISTGVVENIETSLAAIKDLKTEIVIFGDCETKHTKFSEFLKPSPEETNFKPVGVKNHHETCAILCSSGTTSLPKLICLNHFAIEKCARLYSITHSDLTLPENSNVHYSTTFWSSTHGTMAENIFQGFIRLIAEDFNPVQFWNIMRLYKPTKFVIISLMLQEGIKHKPKDAFIPPHLKILLSGVPTSDEQLKILRRELPGAIVTRIYGMVEVGTLVFMHDVISKEGLESAMSDISSYGVLVPGNRAKIVDLKTRKILPFGQPGEVLLKTEWVMNGYYGMDSSHVFECGWFKTGDIGMIDERGHFHFYSRVVDVFTYKNVNVYPRAIEEIIELHPAVFSMAVFGVPHPDGYSQAMAVVILRNGHEGTKSEEIVEFVNGKVDEPQKLWGGVKIVKKFPLNSCGKIKYIELKRLANEGGL